MSKVRLSNAIVSDYLRRIGSGEMKPGDNMPAESAMCDEYGVGRSVVREALQALDAKGFILVRQGSVAVVAPRYQWHVLDPEFLDVTNPEEYFSLVHEVREVLEPAIAALAASRATEDAIAEMDEINRRLERVIRSPDEHAELDIAVHDAIARATDNAILVSMHTSLTGLGYRTRTATAAVDGAISRAIDWHDRIIDAIRDRDPVGASAAMHLHLRQVRHDLPMAHEPVSPDVEGEDHP